MDGKGIDNDLRRGFETLQDLENFPITFMSLEGRIRVALMEKKRKE